MSGRPRIRTVKPEMRQDERYGRLSIWARELFNGLITMADDEGRVRALPSAIIGHVFPYDADAPRKLAGWLREVVESGMVLAYEHDGIPYLAFRRWRRHQKINRATPSELPPPPDPVVVRDNSLPKKEPLHEDSVKAHGELTEDSLPPAQARGPVRSVPDEEEPSQGSGTVDARALEAVDDERLTTTVELLRQCRRFHFDLELLGVANVLAMYPAPHDHEQAARLAVSRGVDPAYRTTDAARALEFAFADLAKRQPKTPVTGKELRYAGDLSRFDQLDGRAA